MPLEFSGGGVFDALVASDKLITRIADKINEMVIFVLLG